MSAIAQPNALTFYSDTATVAKGSVVKGGSDNAHVAKSAAATSLNMGIAMNASAAVGDKLEVALPGGGAKGLLGGTVAMGDLLTSDANGALVATTTPGDRVIAMAMEAGVVGDLIACHVVAVLI